MSQDVKKSSIDITRRRFLGGAGAVGITAVAGCLGDDGEKPFHVRLEVNSNSDDSVDMVELIAQSLEDSGYFSTEIEGYEWNNYTSRVTDLGYGENGFLPLIGFSGTFNPESFCRSLHHSDNRGQCCNVTGINDTDLDEMLENARYGVDVAEDEELRAERYDEIWTYLAEERYSSITHFDLNAAVMNANVHGFSMFPLGESIYSYGLYAPQDEQVTWIDEDAHPNETDLSDLNEGGTLRAGIGANVKSFDPPYSTDMTSMLAQEFVFESLLAADSEGNLYPWLAERYELVDVQDIDRTDYGEYMITVDADDEGALDTDEQVILRHPEDNPVADDDVRILTPDEAADAVDDGVFGMHFRYELREGVTFHNGEELTAEHVVRTFERYETSDVSAQTFDSVLYANADDEYAVSIYAQIPDAEAERELPGVAVHSLEQADLDGGDLNPRNGNEPIGTGPYVFEEFSDEQYVEYSKNDDYWVESLGVEQLDWFDGPSAFPDGPVIDAIELEIVPEDSLRSGALQNDEIDITNGLSTDDLDDYDDSDEYVVESIEAGGYEYIQYPVNVEPWDDERLRRAVNHLIPRGAIVERILNGWAREAWTDIPELAVETGTVDADALEEEIRPYNEYDPERAEELLEDVLGDRG